MSHTLRHDPASASIPALAQVVTFSVGEVRFAVDVRSVREIVRPATPTRVPHASPSIAGVIDWRGRVIPLVDLRTRFGFSAQGSPEHTRFIITEAIGRICALAVDRVHELKTIEAAPRPATDLPRSVAAAGLTDLCSARTADGDDLILIDCSELFGPASTIAA